MTLEKIKWMIQIRIAYLEDSLALAQTVQEANEINYAIKELEILIQEFTTSFS